MATLIRINSGLFTFAYKAHPSWLLPPLTSPGPSLPSTVDLAVLAFCLSLRPICLIRASAGAVPSLGTSHSSLFSSLEPYLSLTTFSRVAPSVP